MKRLFKKRKDLKRIIDSEMARELRNYDEWLFGEDAIKRYMEGNMMPHNPYAFIETAFSNGLNERYDAKTLATAVALCSNKMAGAGLPAFGGGHIEDSFEIVYSKCAKKIFGYPSYYVEQCKEERPEIEQAFEELWNLEKRNWNEGKR